MSADLMPFDFDGRVVRTVLVEGQPWFVAADVCAILGLGQVSRAVARLTSDGVTTSTVMDAMGREQQANVVNEPNLYKLIFQSRKPEAERFTAWVTSEVLPSIRKYGVYATAIPSHAEALELAAKEMRHREALQKENHRLALRVIEDRPKVDLYEAAMKSGDALSFEQAAKVLNYEGIGQNRLFDYCRAIKLLRGKPHRTPYQEYVDRGYFKVIEQIFEDGQGRTRVATKTLIYQRGLDFIRGKLQDSGYVQRVVKPAKTRQLALVRKPVCARDN